MSTKRFDLGNVTEEEIEIPAGPMAARPAPVPMQAVASQPPAPIPVHYPERASTPTTLQVEPSFDISNASGASSNIVNLAMSQFTPAEAKLKTTVAIPMSLNRKLDEAVFQMKLNGFRGITRDAVIIDALQHYFKSQERKQRRQSQ
jgi:hypothetical protein